MSLNQYSTLAEVKAATVVDKADTDVAASIASWEYLTVYNSQATTPASCTSNDCSCDSGTCNYFRIGLFGYDLTEFQTACETSLYCNKNDYFEFDGWAVGMYGMYYALNDYDQGFCFTADQNCVVLYYISGKFAISSFTASDYPNANMPTVAEIEAAVEYGYYGFDNVQWVLPQETVPFAYRFLRSSDNAYWQVSDPDRVW